MFLEQNKPILFNDMILNETLFLHLWEVQQTCVKRMELLMLYEGKTTEDLKFDVALLTDYRAKLADAPELSDDEEIIMPNEKFTGNPILTG